MYNMHCIYIERSFKGGEERHFGFFFGVWRDGGGGVELEFEGRRGEGRGISS